MPKGKRVFNVPIVMNVPVWASSEAEAKKIAGTKALYDETSQLQQGDSDVVYGQVEQIQTAAHAKRLWHRKALPWGRNDMKTVLQLLGRRSCR